MTPARSRTLTIAFALPLALAAAPAQAGFFEDLFGIKNPPASAAAPNRASEPPMTKRARKPEAERRSARREIEANLALKAAQAGKDPATLALQDATLRRGDIVSGSNGLMVFMGGDPETPGEARFVPASDPKLEKRLRESLNGLKRPPAAPAPNAQKPAAAPSEQPVSVERDGKVVRVVGAYPAAQ